MLAIVVLLATAQPMPGAIEAGIPRARRVILKDVGHLMYLEKPTDFSRLGIAFIEQNKSAE